MKNADLPAMPIGEQIDSVFMNPLCNGLTKREYFAAMAMQGYIAGGGSDIAFLQLGAMKDCVIAADRLLEALEK